MEKMTKKDFMVAAAEIVRNSGVVDADIIAEKLEQEAQLIAKRNARKTTSDNKVQKENKHIAAFVVDFFLNHADPEIAYTATEVADVIGLGEFSSQKMTAILKLAEDVVDKKDGATNSKKHKGYQVKSLA